MFRRLRLQGRRFMTQLLLSLELQVKLCDLRRNFSLSLWSDFYLNNRCIYDRSIDLIQHRLTNRLFLFLSVAQFWDFVSWFFFARNKMFIIFSRQSIRGMGEIVIVEQRQRRQLSGKRSIGNTRNENRATCWSQDPFTRIPAVRAGRRANDAVDLSDIS